MTELQGTPHTMVMGANRFTVEQIVRVLLRHLDRKAALKLARDLHNRVEASKGVTDTFARVVESLAHMED